MAGHKAHAHSGLRLTIPGWLWVGPHHTHATQGLKLAFSVTLRFSRPAHSCKSTPGDPQEAQSLCLTF